jgi:two-component system NtrC family sensor kinase
MAAVSLKTRLLGSFIGVILVLAGMIALLGYYVIQREIVGRVDAEVGRALDAARSSYRGEIDRIGEGFRLVEILGQTDVQRLRPRLNVHYLVRVERPDVNAMQSEIVRSAIDKGRPVGGTRIIGAEELAAIEPNLAEGRLIEIKDTLMARPSAVKRLDAVMAKEYAVPVLDADGRVTAVVYGGRIINRDFEFVDRIRSLVFGNDNYKSKPVGTVTVFQGDVRIATNVVNESGQRAVGTRVSAQVYKAVVEEGRIWRDRAFVVTDWYRTAYEPIHDVDGHIIGILYVGMLEQPFKDMAANILWLFLMIVGGATLLGVVLSLVLAVSISKPLTEVVRGTECLASGDWGYKVSVNTSVKDVNSLAEAFNAMSVGLKEREESLRISNDKLVAANKSYVDLLGFVAHELKGILASAVMNVYSVRDGYLGMINFKQQKAVDSIARNLDYLTGVVQKFLSLGRIERGELSLHKTPVLLGKDVFDVSLDALASMASRKRLAITYHLDPAVKVSADADLMRIVANNLITNAIKYTPEGGRVTVSSSQEDDRVQVEVFNESTPMSDADRARLFKKFSRLDNDQTKKVKGTGLGLYITKQIVEAHGGRIWAEPRETGNAFLFQIERGLDSGECIGSHQEKAG